MLDESFCMSIRDYGIPLLMQLSSRKGNVPSKHFRSIWEIVLLFTQEFIVTIHSERDEPRVICLQHVTVAGYLGDILCELRGEPISEFSRNPQHTQPGALD